MGDWDLSREIEYVLQNTGQEKLAYVGHSQGSTEFFYALAHNEKYFAQKVSIFVALGPVTQVNYIRSSLFKFLAIEEE